ncbi:hypothetical protein [Paenibacillus sp. 22594]|uniref:hypothetical protein n=1 Tax=Paenibacillus sp. 22594 TaxID=3453947 RepID=UPI003F835B87
MYDQEVVIEMNHNHRTLLKSYDEWLELLNVYLTEQAFPQNLSDHVTLYFATRFHKSALALRLLLISGYCEESCGVLQMMAEYTIILKSMRNNPDWDIQRMAEEGHLREWLEAVHTPCSSGKYPQLVTDLEELILPVGPAPFDAGSMLEQACRLAALVLGPVPEADAQDTEPFSSP